MRHYLSVVGFVLALVLGLVLHQLRSPSSLTGQLTENSCLSAGIVDVQVLECTGWCTWYGPLSLLDSVGASDDLSIFPENHIDFWTDDNEKYDIYTSDVDGNYQEDGEYISIDLYAVNGDAGGNIDAAYVVLADGLAWFATSARITHPGAIPGQQGGLAESAIGLPDLETTYMGGSADDTFDDVTYPRLTLGFCPVCGNFLLEGNEECDTGDVNSDRASCTSQCRYNICGDNKRFDGVEQCDDGNTHSGDGCSAFCENEVSPTCGDGIINQDTEQCDDGSTCVDGRDCTIDPSVCADLVDDSCSSRSRDGCSDTCTEEPPRCGDGILNQVWEECDMGDSATTTPEGVTHNNGFGPCSSSCKVQCLIDYTENPVGETYCNELPEERSEEKCTAMCLCGDRINNTSPVGQCFDECIPLDGSDSTGQCLDGDPSGCGQCCVRESCAPKTNDGSAGGGSQCTEFDLLQSGCRMDPLNCGPVGGQPDPCGAWYCLPDFDNCTSYCARADFCNEDDFGNTCGVPGLCSDMCGNGLPNVGEECGEPGLSCSIGGEALTCIGCRCLPTRCDQTQCDDGDPCTIDYCAGEAVPSRGTDLLVDQLQCQHTLIDDCIRDDSGTKNGATDSQDSANTPPRSAASSTTGDVDFCEECDSSSGVMCTDTESVYLAPVGFFGPQGDYDGDGIVNQRDADIDGDGIDNAEDFDGAFNPDGTTDMGPLDDRDGDGIANYLDADFDPRS